MIETFKFAKHYHGRSSFAKFQVEFFPDRSRTDIQVREEVVRPVDTGAGEFAPSDCPSWFSVAKRAMEDVAQRASATGLGGELCLRRIIGLPTDTDEDAVACAAALAAARLILPSGLIPKVTDAPPWRIIW